MIIKKAKYINKDLDGVKLTFTDNSEFTIPTFLSRYMYTDLFNEWVKSGGSIDPEFTEAELLQQAQAELSNAVQSHLDTKAQEFRYDSMNSARSYAGYTNAFQAEAVSLGVWASECWVCAGQVEADVLAGNRTMPTPAELIAELPVYVGL